MRKYNITKKACFSAVLVLTGTMLIGMSALADGTGRRNNIRSKGKIDYGNGEVVLDSSDLTYLADEIDVLERTYKQFTLEYLNGINTYLDADGNVTHDWAENDDSYFPTFAELLNGIDLSQEVSTGTTVDNLSKDKGAWVNGEYIEGNGNDVNEAYLKGLKDGLDNAMENCTISYVYHRHVTGDGTESTGNIYSTSNPGGCYVAAGHTHNATGSCSSGQCTVEWVDHINWVNTEMHRATWTRTEYHSSCGAGIVETTHGGVYNPPLENGEYHFPPTVSGTSIHSYYTCGSYVNTWVLGCGKTTSTIESATIVFNE